MRNPLPAIIPHYPSEKDRLVRLLALFLSVLMLAAVLLESLHHHDDELDHPDCAICAVALHHSSDSAVPFPVALCLPTAFLTFFTLLITTVVVTRTIHSPQN